MHGPINVKYLPHSVLDPLSVVRHYEFFTTVVSFSFCVCVWEWEGRGDFNLSHRKPEILN